MTPAELDEYCARVGYTGPREPTLPVLHALTSAHARSVPFENLDVLLGEPIELTVDALVDKLVRRRRGGYCFEQNGLFLAVLTAFGFAAAPLSARVRLGRPRDVVPPRTHLFLRVELDGATWLTDVGIGGVSLTSAIRWEPDGADQTPEQPTPHEPRRIVREDGRWFHQVRFGEQWVDAYEFTGEEMPLVDREVGNWFTSTHPRSHFRHRLMVARAGADGTRLTLTDTELKVRDGDGRAESSPIGSPQELLAALDEHFGLRFAAGTTFHPLAVSV
ncbi:arylamine N-acetyltransferase family protein [Pseudonocardia humida]|nr:arylamine N-acetyltransferase [Pseudonocardia humida]